MKALVLATVAAASLAPAPRAAASSCGGGGGGGGGAHGGGAPSVAGGAPACEDASDVVGFRRCRKFGAWGAKLRRPQITLATGVVVQRFASLLDRQTGTVAHGPESFTYRVLSPARGRGRDTAVLATMRVDLGLPHGLYTALQLDLGGLVQARATATETMTAGTFGSPELAQEQGLVVGGTSAVGVRGAASFGRLAVELAGGARGVSYSFASRYHGCPAMTSITAVAPIAEARVRGELWLTPWVTAGVTLGTSLLERDAWLAGVYLGVHDRAFGGDR